ncbi:MAG: hypothetical protein R2695_13330 [Acidimicrobiales bacterium]
MGPWVRAGWEPERPPADVEDRRGLRPEHPAVVVAGADDPCRAVASDHGDDRGGARRPDDGHGIGDGIDRAATPHPDQRREPGGIGRAGRTGEGLAANGEHGAAGGATSRGEVVEGQVVGHRGSVRDGIFDGGPSRPARGRHRGITV